MAAQAQLSSVPSKSQPVVSWSRVSPLGLSHMQRKREGAREAKSFQKFPVDSEHTLPHLGDLGLETAVTQADTWTGLRFY